MLSRGQGSSETAAIVNGAAQVVGKVQHLSMAMAQACEWLRLCDKLRRFPGDRREHMMWNQLGLETMEQRKQALIDVGLRYGPRVLTALLILVGGALVSSRAGRAAARWLSRMNIDLPLQKLLRRIVAGVVFVLFGMMALQNLGVELLPLFASLGVVGVGVSLAAQGVLGNLVAGLTIIFTQPFRIGEWVSMIGVEGRVDSIDLFSTTLSLPDRSKVVVPNRKIVGEVLHNYGAQRQLSLSVGVAYSTDLPKTLAVLRQVLANSRRVVQELEPVIGVVALGESTIQIAVRPWVAVADFHPAMRELNQAIVEAFRAQQIEIPFPQCEVRLLPSGDDGPNA